MCGFTVYTGSDKKTRIETAGEFQKLKYRGPDNTLINDMGENGWMGFHRLKIMDISNDGNQPMIYDHISLVCNGEVYNYPELKEKYPKNYSYSSSSDCEVIIPMFMEKGVRQTALELDAEFVFVIVGWI